MKYTEKAKVKILPKPAPIAHSPQTPSPLVSVSPRYATTPILPAPKRSKSAAAVTSSNATTANAGPELKRQRKASNSVSPRERNNNKSEDSPRDSSHKQSKQTGHRPVTSCTFCRQHKIKCNASDNYPQPCQRCERMGLKCEIDPEFRPKKGSQIQSLKSDVDELKAKIDLLTKNESLLTQALSQHNMGFINQTSSPHVQPQHSPQQQTQLQSQSHTPSHPQPQRSNSYPNPVISPMVLPSSSTYAHSPNMSPISSVTKIHQSPSLMHDNSDNSPSTMSNFELKEENYQPISEFVLGDVTLPLAKANELHHRFMTKNLKYFPIINSRSATELYHKSNLLFWVVILTASLGEPEPTLYMSLASLIKQLAIETCWIKTPRSTHVIQALIILSIWPLPNEKVLDDCSYRFVGLAKNLSLQLGLHRGGEFIQEFSRNQVSLGPDAEKWRTRSWLALFFCEQFWSSLLGLPPSINTTDYLLENARVDQSLPKEFRCLISLSIFQCKLVNVMGISVTRPDGLLEPSNRAGSLNLLDRELERLRFKLQIEEGSPIEVYYLYIKLMICCFAFLPGTPIEDQVKYVSSAYLSATRIITIVSKMNQETSLIELPIYIRQAVSYSVLLLFKLHLSKYLFDKYVDSARQSIVTVHRMFRNTLSSWQNLQNDMSRTAKVLENLNIVLYTYPDLFLQGDKDEGSSIISRMRSHLTASLFYDLVWCVHEGKRRTALDKGKPPSRKVEPHDKKLLPLPFYNQITKDDFTTITTTTPNGTTITTLVPTDQAMNQAKSNAGDNKPLEINGIPLSMLEATGSTRDIMNVQEPESQIIKNESPMPQQQQHQQQSYPQRLQLQQATPILESSAPTQQQPPQLQSQQLPQQPPFQFGQSPPPQSYLPTIEEVNVNEQYSVFNNEQQQHQQNPPTQPGEGGANVAGATGSFVSQIDSFFQQQSNGWMDNQDDDFLGWFDVNMLPDQ
ncbi:Sef1 transcription factor [Candida orthopsilosis Co 90-125]|uniref:Sef1 transcription factor n=1 Tax=Candida orthopsilosis (strain 90-125) TaxID=1136231 RepID=H8WVR7_CANO9|nr:Sef1 transcription factor [Candida orthopsilosis Co 90-125]CCG20540.1 Sef1 transcription factor [Candida orthopsilosis Co 90-125]